MKTKTLIILQTRLKNVNILIKEYDFDLKVAKKNPSIVSDSKFEMLHQYLSDYNIEKLNLLDCIDWIKSVEKKDLITHRTNS